MSTDKPEDQITEAGATELEEAQLDTAAGGVIAVSHEVIGTNNPPDPVLVAQKVRTY
jgi:hypothetical protein